MSESIHRYFLYHYPTLPGGGATVGVIFFMLISLLILHRRTQWGGWLALFFYFTFYTIPLLTEFHKR